MNCQERSSDLNVRTRHLGYQTGIVERSGSDPTSVGECTANSSELAGHANGAPRSDRT